MMNEQKRDFYPVTIGKERKITCSQLNVSETPENHADFFSEKLITQKLSQNSQFSKDFRAG